MEDADIDGDDDGGGDDGGGDDGDDGDLWRRRSISSYSCRRIRADRIMTYMNEYTALVFIEEKLQFSLILIRVKSMILKIQAYYY